MREFHAVDISPLVRLALGTGEENEFCCSEALMTRLQEPDPAKTGEHPIVAITMMVTAVQTAALTPHIHVLGQHNGPMKVGFWRTVDGEINKWRRQETLIINAHVTGTEHQKILLLTLDGEHVGEPGEELVLSVRSYVIDPFNPHLHERRN